LVMERSCQWKLLHWPAAFSSDYPLYARTTTDPVTGETELGLRDRDNRLLLSMILAPVPAARGVTAVRWRAKVGEGAPWPARILRRFNPVTMHQSIDGAVLRMLNPSVSSVFEKLRSSLQMAPLRAA